jgi:hypothetical protein
MIAGRYVSKNMWNQAKTLEGRSIVSESDLVLGSSGGVIEDRFGQDPLSQPFIPSEVDRRFTLRLLHASSPTCANTRTKQWERLRKGEPATI